MNSFTIKGVCIGQGRPKTIVSLMEPTEDGLVACAREAVCAGAECLEWRADFARDVHDPAAMARTARALAATLPHTPLIFTFRSAGQGGRCELAMAEYMALNQAVVETGAIDLVDIEVGIGAELVAEQVAFARDRGTRTIVSHHDFAKTPSATWMYDELLRMARLGADVPKLAVMAHGTADCLRLMEATARARDALGQPVLTMAMGADGMLSRLAGETFGSALTFCALGDASAPGQVELADARRVLESLHAAMGAH